MSAEECEQKIRSKEIVIRLNANRQGVGVEVGDEMIYPFNRSIRSLARAISLSVQICREFMCETHKNTELFFLNSINVAYKKHQQIGEQHVHRTSNTKEKN